MPPLDRVPRHYGVLMSHLPRLSRPLVMLVLCAVVLSGCAITNRLFRDTAAEERAAELLQMQLAVMRFADEYAARVAERVAVFQRATDDPGDRLVAQTWLVSQATAAFTIASGPNPELNAIDMLVFATLSRMVIEDRWVNGALGQRAEGVLAVHQALEKRIWDYSTVLLTQAQIDELRSAIEAWHRENPVGRAVPFIHLEDFAFATSGMRTGSPSSSSIFSFLGIDPLSNLDPAVRELAQSRQLAERAVYYGQRAPTLVSMEAQRLAFEMAVTPESVRLLDSVGRIGNAAQTTSQVAADLPALLAQERAAVIEQLTGVYDERQEQLQALVVELRAALEAGGTTSDSVRETITTLDALLARFDRSAAPAAGGAARPFDVTEYTEALRQLGVAAQQLQALLSQADSKAPALAQVSDGAANRVTSLVDHMYWRLVQLVLLLVAASVLGALAYRAIVRRWS
jgi:hypothetical protein